MLSILLFHLFLFRERKEMKLSKANYNTKQLIFADENSDWKIREKTEQVTRVLHKQITYRTYLFDCLPNILLQNNFNTVIEEEKKKLL